MIGNKGTKNTKHTKMEKSAFTTSDIARISHHSRETVKRWLEKGEMKGYRVGPSGHWRVLPVDLAEFLMRNNIPFPAPAETGCDLRSLIGGEEVPSFCWEFFGDSTDGHVRSNARCEDCVVYKTRSLNCYVLREEVAHKKVFCRHSCEECHYFRFQQKGTKDPP